MSSNFKNIDEYIEQYTEEKQYIMQKVRKVILENAPEAEERIHYRMPCFWQGTALIYFAAMKNHLGIYPTNSGVVNFTEDLKEYNTSKGAIQLPWDKPIPYDLIIAITRFRVEEVTTKNK